MNSLIYSVLAAVVAVFHLAMSSYMRKGNIKTGFCAIWCMDAIFAICGTVISFMLYQYRFHKFLTVRNVVLILIYMLITILFVWLAPTGIGLLGRKRETDAEQLLLAEYRLNDTLGMVRNFFMILLFLLPVLLAVVQREGWFLRAVSWKETEICGGFCFVAFLLLIPVCLRQALYWLKNLTDASVETEQKLLQKHCMQLQYRQRNRFL